jgi:serine/threonine protein kinase
MIKNCDSKFLVKLHSTFQDRKYVYLVMEYVSGGDLLHLLIEEDIFTEEDTKFYIAELIVAIEEIHSRNFIHRDIKPDNILIDPSGHIKISDFGLSKYVIFY